MAERQQNTTFPAPPPFYRHSTRQNIDLDRSHGSIQTDDSTGNERITIEQRRALRYLTPPEPPVDGKWRSFGIEHELDASEVSLQEAGIEQLFPDHPSVKLAPQAYLLAMARSLLSTFLATTAVLAQNPALYTKKVEDLRTIAVNMHYLINQYRPHQARETLIDMMEKRLESLQSDIDAINGAKTRLAEVATQLQEKGHNHAEDATVSGQANGQDTAGKSSFDDLSILWDMLDRLAVPVEEQKAQAAEEL